MRALIVPVFKFILKVQYTVFRSVLLDRTDYPFKNFMRVVAYAAACHPHHSGLFSWSGTPGIVQGIIGTLVPIFVVDLVP